MRSTDIIIEPCFVSFYIDCGIEITSAAAAVLNLDIFVNLLNLIDFCSIELQGI